MEDPILFWNKVALEANRLDHTAPMRAHNQQGPTRSSRAIALIHLAMHDAYFGVAGGQTLYQSGLPAFPLPAPGAVPKVASAAVSAAASVALTTLYPDFRALVTEQFSLITAINGSDAAGHTFGQKVAAGLFALRANDGANTDPDAEGADYVESPLPGHHREDPLSAGQGYLGVRWGRVTPLAITSWHPLTAPPVQGQPLYNTHFNEVKGKGGAPSQPGTNRTPDETAGAYYWAYDGVKELGTPPRLYNQIIRGIAMAQNTTVAENARLFTLVNVARVGQVPGF